nr:MAG TPA: hypothetical protein [Caudoviricetes sp.]DAI94566.1 MAG TPA: hypothetical protein [Caudoviricetes sp.]
MARARLVATADKPGSRGVSAVAFVFCPEVIARWP